MFFVDQDLHTCAWLLYQPGWTSRQPQLSDEGAFRHCCPPLELPSIETADGLLLRSTVQFWKLLSGSRWMIRSWCKGHVHAFCCASTCLRTRTNAIHAVFCIDIWRLLQDSVTLRLSPVHLTAKEQGLVPHKVSGRHSNRLSPQIWPCKQLQLASQFQNGAWC